MDWSEDSVETRFVQPYEAVKLYVAGLRKRNCRGVGHVVAVPRLAPDLGDIGIRDVGITGETAHL